MEELLCGNLKKIRAYMYSIALLGSLQNVIIYCEKITITLIMIQYTLTKFLYTLFIIICVIEVSRVNHEICRNIARRFIEDHPVY